MGEELIPGLVRVIEERMGWLGRPFTTTMVILAGLGVMAWGGSMFFKNVIAPIIAFAGVEINQELVAAFVILAMVVAIFGLGALLTAYGVERIRGRGSSARLQQQESEIAELRSQLESREQEDGGSR